MMNSHLPVGVIGISHKTASVEIRDRVVLTEAEQRTAVKKISQEFDVDGCMVISTCNRTEIYISGETLHEETKRIRDWLNELKGCQYFTDQELIYELHGTEAVHHYFKVISGMDSQIIGETQITGQVLDAYELAHKLGVTDSVLNKLFNFAMQAKKRVRNETFLCDGTVSVSFAGVELARKIFNNLKNKEILVVGAGKTAELAAFHFMENDLKNIHVVNRTLEKAKKLAGAYQGQAYGLDQLELAIRHADIVISATSSQQYVITHALMQEIAKERHHKPIFLIDLAIPRDIDPGIQNIDGVFLYNLDDLQEIVDINLKKRQKELPRSMKIVGEFVYEFQKWNANNSMASLAGRLKKQLDTLRINEIERLKSRFPEEGMQEINYLTESIINKVVRQHIKSLKKNASDPERYQQHVDLLYNLYEIEKD